VISKIILYSCGCGYTTLRPPANLCRRDGLHLESTSLVRKICFLIKQVGKMHLDVSPKKNLICVQDIWFQLYDLVPQLRLSPLLTSLSGIDFYAE